MLKIFLIASAIAATFVAAQSNEPTKITVFSIKDNCTVSSVKFNAVSCKATINHNGIEYIASIKSIDYSSRLSTVVEYSLDKYSSSREIESLFDLELNKHFDKKRD